MRLRRLALSAYRCFSGRVEIDGLNDGLTIIVGDNEEGKSTLLAALQSVLFDRHNLSGEAADAMLPYDSAVRPEITLEFDLNNRRFRLRKAFCQRPEAELVALGNTGTRWTGAAAEERLREMLAFTPRGRGGAQSENRGLQALFWVEQGNAHLVPSLNEAARGTLAGALEHEVGTVVGGERGRVLVERIKVRLERFFTPKGRPKAGGALAAAQTQAEEACARRDELRGQLAKFEEKVGGLARARQRLADLERDDPLGVADARIEAATAAVKILEGLESDLRAAVARLRAAEAEAKLAGALVTARQQLRSEMEKAHRESTTAAEEETRMRGVLATADASLGQIEHAHAGARREVEEAAGEAANTRLFVELLEARAHVTEAGGELAKAEHTAVTMRELLAKVEANPLDSKALRSLRELAMRAREADLRLQTSATLIEFQPAAGHRATIDGTVVESDTRILDEPTRILLEGFGAIRVVPGGEELASVRAKAARTHDALARALATHAVATLQEAERHADERERLAVEANAYEAILATQAPAGLEELRSSVEVLRIRVQELERVAKGSRTEVADMSIDVAREQATAAAKRLAECQKAERKASDIAIAEDGQRKLTAAALVMASARRADAFAKAAALAAQAENAEAEAGDDVLGQRHKTAAAALADAALGNEEAERRVRESDPEGARAELDHAREARAVVARQLDDARRGTDDLTIELRALGQQDVAARLEIAEGDTIRADAAHARVTHEAEALQLLHRTLTEAEREAREMFMAPITRRIAPYLRRLFPDSEIVLDDNTLEITHLRRHGHDEPFQRLSVGTREQLAVLTRLAFADLLREHGKDSPIVLDDALVYSDDDRFAKLQQILARASFSTQIILLTCHERAYFSLGAPIIRLAECGA